MAVNWNPNDLGDHSVPSQTVANPITKQSGSQIRSKRVMAQPLVQPDCQPRAQWFRGGQREPRVCADPAGARSGSPLSAARSGYIAAVGCARALYLLIAGCGRLSFDPPGSGDGPIAGCVGSALLCDDFEGGDFARWSDTDLNGGTVAVNTARPRAGSYSFEAFVMSATSGGRAAARLLVSGPSTGVLAVRLWLNMPQPLVDFDHVIGLANRTEDAYVLVGGDFERHWVVTESTPATGLTDHTSSVETPGLDTWTCVELVYDLDARRIGVFVAEALVLDMASVVAGALEIVHVGIVRADPAGVRVFVDDVVIARSRIGCS